MNVIVLLATLAAGQPEADKTCPADAIADNIPIRMVGAFTNMRYTDEHAYGYSVHLWRAGECVFGLFLSSAGLAGDTPTGRLELVKYTESTGALTFRARLTMGSFSNREYRDVPSRDVYEFSGLLRDSLLGGSVRHTNVLTPLVEAAPENVILRRDPADADSMIRAETFGEWQQKAAAVLGVRGPKW